MSTPSTSFTPASRRSLESWTVSKFGGTSVASASLMQSCGRIILDNQGAGNQEPSQPGQAPPQPPGRHVAVVSAMGSVKGGVKVTDLLLGCVAFAAERDWGGVEAALENIRAKHLGCIRELGLLEGEGGEAGERGEGLEVPTFDAPAELDAQVDAPAELDAGTPRTPPPPPPPAHQAPGTYQAPLSPGVPSAFPSSPSAPLSSLGPELVAALNSDLQDLKDVLKTVSLMKWKPAKISELVSGYGELWSSRIMTAMMRSMDRSGATEYVHLDARKVIIVEEDEDDDKEFTIRWDLTEARMQQFLDGKKGVYANLRAKGRDPATTGVCVVATGYVASNTQGVTSTLKRDGSDYSAAILGKVLAAESVTIWTDVDGVLSADPRRVPNSLVLPEVSYNEAMELAYFGAKVIHPKTMQPAILASPPIPIYIRNTFNPSFRGTRIFTSSNTHATRDRCVCGFASIDRMAVLNVEGSGLVGVKGVSRRMFGALEERGINVVLIAQASSEHSITLALSEDSAVVAQKILTDVFAKELASHHLEDISVISPCSIIAAVGDGMSSTTGVAGRFFCALGDAKINVICISQGCSERNISCVVMSDEATRALRAVHSTFRLSETAIRVGVITDADSDSCVGTSLLKLLETQRGKMRINFDIDVQVVCVQDTRKILSMRNGGSITASAWKTVDGSVDDLSLKTPGSAEKLESLTSEALLRDECAHTLIFDCTADAGVAKSHPKWLAQGIHVVTANNTALSGEKALRDEIAAAELSQGAVDPGRYLREVCIGGSLPIIRTLTDLINGGDRLSKIDGIFSVSFSFIMTRISPANGDEPILLSAAVQEAIAAGMMETDPTSDLSNEYTARCLMVLAKELDMSQWDVERIMGASQNLVDPSQGELGLQAADAKMQKLCAAAKANGKVLRHVSSIDLRTSSISISFEEVPPSHIFATTPAGCETVRFYTKTYDTHPLIVMGQAEGLDNTASALLAEMLNLMQSKVGSKKLSRTNSNVQSSSSNNVRRVSSRSSLLLTPPRSKKQPASYGAAFF
ncbi:hypothetical protein TeGR_g11281 [Tetraparma gracilis]|uniref:Homoserine dehydrogenase n=1 Tax=Tetraparma gracilis TaxID=2962635 RepID=A0ABQ6N433_9STRA|nr:hypothetical protein TeGR_g11281 [Tetraparma gracilis]